MDGKRIPKGLPQTHRQPSQAESSKRLPLPAHQENLMRLQGMIGNQAVQRMIQREIVMDEMEVPVEEESSGPVVLDEMEVPVQGGSDESGAVTRPDGVVEFPPDYGPDSDGKESTPKAPQAPQAPKDSTDESGAELGPDGVWHFPPDHGPDADGSEGDFVGPPAPKDSADGSGAKTRPDGVVEFPEDHVPSEGEPTVGPDGELQFPPDHVPSGDEGGSWMENLPFF